ncbi:enoyl-CoA hydratase domain-containing protein 3, mitochondrial-like isoform X2 [Uloborus diversus]|uniref:enoyl-CoA hydratase domain-containing protein 3, mitochondrial-like isoform X2 n=1 Tax=Uloborus diversus TaxID=327109 RepID=UPI002409CC37|nr:enoyl-CoA hydratase domain-containing protein 3, mitochondrial-like isoform X2 [Uloborus diversus]
MVFQRPSRLFSSEAELTIVSEKDGVRKILLNNPKKRNALSLAMLESLKSCAFRDVNSPSLRCILLQSTGPVFSSGHDLKELLSSDTGKREEIFRKCSELMVGLRNLPVPTVAVVNGLAAAAGCQLVASCDIAVATSTSEFSTPGASVGLFCSTPGVAVSRNVPLKTASYMLFTGKNINAHRAVQSGLISKVVDESEMEAAIEDILQSILSKSRSVLALGKKYFYEQLSCNLEEAYRKGSKVMVDNLAHHDASEGIKAFFEKRPPKWVKVEES